MSQTEPTVSVVIPTHNRSSFVLRAIESVRRQTFPPSEILVIDDGSTDDTVARIESRFSDVRVLTQPNRGVSSARNVGITQSRGEWIAFLDSDDEWLPAKLERQFSELAREPEAPLSHTDEIWIRRGRRVNPMKKHRKYGGHIFERCLPLCVISPSSALVRRSLFDVVGRFDEALPACEDYDLWLRVCARFPVSFVDETLTVKNGGHDDQLSRRYWGMDRFRITALEKILATDWLGAAERRAAERVLSEKIAVYAAGAKKRGKLREARAYESRLPS